MGTRKCLYLSLQQGHFVREEADDMLLPESGGEQVAEGGARGGQEAGQGQTLPGPKQSPGQHVLYHQHRTHMCLQCMIM